MLHLRSIYASHFKIKSNESNHCKSFELRMRIKSFTLRYRPKIANESYVIKVVIIFEIMLISSVNKYAGFYESQALFRFASNCNLEKGRLEYRNFSLNYMNYRQYIQVIKSS